MGKYPPSTHSVFLWMPASPSFIGSSFSL
jgi:hypothetical protein